LTGAKPQLSVRDENQDMCNRVNLDYFGTPTTTTTTTTNSALPATTSTPSSSAATEKINYSRASAHLLLGVAFVLVILEQQF